MNTGKFVKKEHRAYCILLFYSGVRRTEARRPKRKDFSLQHGLIFFDVGKRLKHSKQTDPIVIPLDAPYAQELWDVIEQTPQGEKVFQFSDKTAYNAVRRVFKYPHYFRLTRITWHFEQHRTITQVKSLTGLTLQALEFYAGKVDTLEAGKALSNPT